MQTVKKDIRELIDAAVEDRSIPGCNLLILKDGKEVIYYEAGYAEIETKRKISRNTIFRLYSMTKPVTAVALMLLQEQGCIDVKAPVWKYIPEYKELMVQKEGKLCKAEKELTIYNLLNMTSGFTYDIPGSEMEGVFQELNKSLDSVPVTTREAVRKFSHCPLAFEPGASWCYGISADILGAVIEAVAEMELSLFLQKEIFMPLDMKDTGFYVPEEKRERLAAVYQKDFNGNFQLYQKHHLGVKHQMDVYPLYQSGGAGLVSTIDDYAAFSQMLLCEGVWNHKRILRADTIKYLRKSRLTPMQQQGFETAFTNHAGHSYGNLMFILEEEEKALSLGKKGEYGWDSWLGCYFVNNPKDHSTMLYMQQVPASGTTPLVRKIKDRFYQYLK